MKSPTSHRRTGADAGLVFDEPRREHLLDVGRPLERQVVDADQDAVLRDGEILLDEVGPLLHRELVGLDRVLRRVGRCAAMRDQLLLRRRRAPGERR